MEKHRYKSSDIARVLATEIREQRQSAGTPVLPVRALAKRFGVSGVTADRALKRLELDDLVYRVPGRGTYVKHEPRKLLRIGYAASVCDPRHVNPNSRMRGINLYAPHALAEFAGQGYEPELISWRELLDPILAGRRLNGLDGLLIAKDHIEPETICGLRCFKGVAVCFEQEFLCENMPPYHQVYPDWQIGLRQAFAKLNPEQYEKIIIIHAPHENALNRFRQIEKTLLEFSCHATHTLCIRYAHGDSGQLSAYQAFRPLIPQCRGALLISTSDYFSFGIVEQLRDHGIMPGRDISILSMDNVEGAGIHPYAEPFLSSIDGSMAALARESVRLLLARLREPDDRTLHHVIIPTHTIFRKSTIEH